MAPSKSGIRPAATLCICAVLSLWLAASAGADAPAPGVSITAFSASPASIGARTGGETVEVGLNLTLHNSGSSGANVTITISEKGKPLLAKNVSIVSNGSYDLSLAWKLEGTGDHTATATITGGNVTAPATMQATCNVWLLPLLEHPSPWYTIPCAFLFIIIPSVGIWLFIRYLKRGGAPEDGQNGAGLGGR